MWQTSQVCVISARIEGKEVEGWGALSRGWEREDCHVRRCLLLEPVCCNLVGMRLDLRRVKASRVLLGGGWCPL